MDNEYRNISPWIYEECVSAQFIQAQVIIVTTRTVFQRRGLRVHHHQQEYQPLRIINHFHICRDKIFHNFWWVNQRCVWLGGRIHPRSNKSTTCSLHYIHLTTRKDRTKNNSKIYSRHTGTPRYSGTSGRDNFLQLPLLPLCSLVLFQFS